MLKESNIDEEINKKLQERHVGKLEEGGCKAADFNYEAWNKLIKGLHVSLWY